MKQYIKDVINLIEASPEKWKMCSHFYHHTLGIETYTQNKFIKLFISSSSVILMIKGEKIDLSSKERKALKKAYNWWNNTTSLKNI